MNAYKRAWYTSTLVGVDEVTRADKLAAMKSNSPKRSAVSMTNAAGKIARESGIALAHEVASRASKTAMTGNLGATLRIGGRVGVRVIPVVGYALLAYDLYQFGKYMMEE